ncbi:MAG: hybrid sensor histidine kinase/response regulator [Bacteroidota bacterium]|nr:hybrid sensor histidine kinase/response regulator [Candidatus Kapabacteria bacterium]MDW8218998.1 hybrid sensor histidine kinase/response regulator [Bacteroidota bacterium]
MSSLHIYPAERVPRILVVDDMLENLQVLRGRLRVKGYELYEASSGNAALELLYHAKHDNSTLPDVILLDVQMPDIDGFEVCRRIKADTELRDIPIIFLTARGDMDDIIQGFELGAVDYIVKPFHAAELLTRIKTHIDLKFSQDALRQSNALLTHLNHEKSELMSIVAHDLKNPLATVRWLVDILKTSSLSSEQYRQTLEAISASVEGMAQLVSNLLDANALDEPYHFSNTLEYGYRHISPEKVNLVFIAAEVLGRYEHHARKKQITTTFHNTATSATVFVNSEILKQILDNLISNAIKYTPYGGTVSILVYNPSENPSAVQVSVQDSGIGIPSHEQHRLFTKFGVTSSKPTGGEHSTGLGLYIVKKLSEAAKGRVSYKPAMPQGSIFSVEFPVFAPQSQYSSDNDDDTT